MVQELIIATTIVACYTVSDIPSTDSLEIIDMTTERNVDNTGNRHRPKRKTTPDQDTRIIADYIGGKSCLALAKEYGMTRLSITKRLIEANVELRGMSD